MMIRRPERSDSIFQLSLTEIAFSLIFILLILLGWMHANTDRKYKEVVAKIEKLKKLTKIEDQLETFESQLMKAGANPDAIISQLVSNTKVVAEAAELRIKLEEMNEQLSQLVNIRDVLDKVRSSHIGEISHEEIIAAIKLTNNLSEKVFSGTGDQFLIDESSDQENKHVLESSRIDRKQKKTVPEEKINRVEKESLAALEFIQELEKAYRVQFNKPLDRSKLQQLAKTLVESSKVNYAKEAADLRGQLAYLKVRLSGGQGRDHPPCWADENTGRIEYLFDIVITQEGLVVEKAWPKHRQNEAENLPRINEILGHTVSKATFLRATEAIFNLSKEKNCRHFVILKNRVNDLSHFNSHRFAVSSVFYTFEPR
ncbi:hypothetical protein Q9L42_020925 (plasmid) [Methylomarinum sp. Ch1-1]|uniref:Uncharacterized protein n=1 Tax=Methylomarinum roseum TaxID=3067653 RepID=A0AAU7P0Q2_9GAMM|nr:hypothetical protein [Methylomarinum sp. Ch1-1]MDP4518988.1 hypothetical protein [Methylomarinum sp. Ch1-1]MDP4523386.1 hypothetical protein [Methylomarinum sp. Ch1-1]